MNFLKKIIRSTGLVSDIGTRNEMHRLEWLEKTLAAIPAGARILDAGAGELAQKRFCTHLDYVSQDFAEYDGSGNGAGLQTGRWEQSNLDIVCDITDITEPDESFDAVMCIEVLEHLPNPIAALREFARLLKPGGRFILTAPFCSLTHFAPYHFHSGFNRYFFDTHLPAHGLTIIELSPNGNFYDFVAQEVRRAVTNPPGDSATTPGLLDTLGAHLFLRYLSKQSESDSNSHETLCYGYHVLAEKQ